ncbi:superinfection immunity protein [Maricaulis maris]|jgi:Superinfection immunity protein|uniref:superinfection immunity protein n=1 Tax=Maricaulis maris TaxID=74318 RepID=UPI00291EAD26|nr:hypothetical protein MACH15_13400 [Maricaulis maris]
MDGAGLLIVVVLAYFLPAVIAGLRQHHNAGAIFLTNLLLGWTFLGWVIALVWSATATRRSDGEHLSGRRPHGRMGVGMSIPERRPVAQELRIALTGEDFANPNGVERQSLIAGLQAGYTLSLAADPENVFDPRAVAVMSATGVIGYLPDDYEDVRAAIRRGRVYPARVAMIDRKSNGKLGVVVGLTPPD